MIISKNNIIQRVPNKPILVDYFFTSDHHKKPVVIFCHGYKGFKDWGAWNLVGKHFAEAGFFFMKFNFSHNGGTLENPIDFPDLEAFGQNNYIKELDDLDAIVNLIHHTNFEHLKEIDLTNIILIGHSRGGGIVTLKASEDHRISRIISWAGVSDFKSRFPKGEAFEHWKREGVYYVINGRTKQKMPHYFQFYTSFIANENRLTIAKAAKNLKIPHLIIHGQKDKSVLPEEALKIHGFNPNSELILIPEGNHVFGTKHPWENDQLPQDLHLIVQKTIDFTRI